MGCSTNYPLGKTVKRNISNVILVIDNIDAIQCDSGDPVPVAGSIKNQTKTIKQKKKTAVVSHR